MTGTSSTLVRRQLGMRLRRLREQAGKTHDDVDESGIAGPTKMWRIESGRVTAKVGDIWALCHLYGANSEITQSLVSLSQGGRGSAFWEEWGESVVPDWLGLYVGLEADANSIRTYEPTLVHGLLQTESYAREIISSDERLPKDVVDQRVAFRLERQRTVLGRSPSLDVVMEEGALRLVVGSPQLMKEQVDHLLEVGRHPKVTLRVIPWDAGAHLMKGAFTLLDFANEDDPSVAYAELPLGARYMENQAHLSEHRYLLTALHQKSLALEEYLDEYHRLDQSHRQ